MTVVETDYLCTTAVAVGSMLSTSTSAITMLSSFFIMSFILSVIKNRT